jgi:hypothetical protein
VKFHRNLSSALKVKQADCVRESVSPIDVSTPYKECTKVIDTGEHDGPYLEGSFGGGGCGRGGRPGGWVWVCIPAAATAPPLALQGVLLQATAVCHVRLIIFLSQLLLTQAGRRPNSERSPRLRAQVQRHIVFCCTVQVLQHALCLFLHSFKYYFLAVYN